MDKVFRVRNQWLIANKLRSKDTARATVPAVLPLLRAMSVMFDLMMQYRGIVYYIELHQLIECWVRSDMVALERDDKYLISL